MELWNEGKIRDFADVKGGKRLPKGKQLVAFPTAHPYIRIRDLGKAKVLQLTSEYEYVDDETQKDISRYIVAEGDILISVVGTIGLIGIVGDSLDGANQTENCDKITNLKGIDRDYLYYYLISSVGQAEISKGTVGAVQPKLPLKNVQDLPIRYPSIPTQRKIGSILSAIDSKIEKNAEINQNLYEQARSLYRHWESSSTDSRCSISDIATINPETYSPKENWEYVNYLDTSSIFSGVIGEIQTIRPSEEKLPSRARRILRQGDIVYSTVRPNQLHYGIVSNPLPNMLGSTGFAVIRSKDSSIPNEIIYLALTEPAFIEQMQQIAEQSVSTFPSIKPSDLDACTIPRTIGDNIELMESIKTCFAIASKNDKENKQLALLRDTLLPKLMSGEVDVSEIDR